MNASRTISCHICQSKSVRRLNQAHSLLQVTSDCRPWPSNGKQVVCLDCGIVAKVIDQSWRDDAERIYRDYSLYQVSGGVEQKKFDGQGKGSPRSALVSQALKRALDLPTKGKLLDVGYGTGAFFSAFHKDFPEWDMYGVEIDDKNAMVASDLPGVHEVYAQGVFGGDGDMLGRFDVVSLIHVLEHIETPNRFLEAIAPHISEGKGVLLVQIPDFSQNPFDLLVADHASHFTPKTLEYLLLEAGYEIIEITGVVVQKEIFAVARPAQLGKGLLAGRIDPVQAAREADAAVSWLLRLASEAKTVATQTPQGRFGLFGTAIAASWLAGLLGDQVAFFVEEDEQRIGRTHLSRPVYASHEVPSESSVYFCLPMPLALAVHDRLTAAGTKWRGHVPPKLRT